MDGETRVTGSCLCGGVTYSLSAPPVFTAICHCRHCQRQTGSAFSLVTGFPVAAYDQSGPTQVYHDTSETGRKLERHFCGICGSAVLSRIEPLADLVLIKSGTLDATEDLQPVVEVFCASRMAFLPDFDGTERHARSNV
ncbi:GFA family protein [Croceicoccus bisphenolivorans]|uniref:GFA family protein n=1 Tax=Croceicoccus bisphenolivorans TaxID=1783232 RepID=UPI000834EBDF|nr:GFA family protein [Croceicoccus bisphenolivorans]